MSAPAVGDKIAMTLTYQSRAKVGDGPLLVVCEVQLYRIDNIGTTIGGVVPTTFLLRRDTFVDLPEWAGEFDIPVRDVSGDAIAENWVRVPAATEADAQQHAMQVMALLRRDCEVFAAAFQMALDEASGEYDGGLPVDAMPEAIDEATKAAQRAVFDQRMR